MSKELKRQKNAYEKISPTAWSVAYGRTFSNVSFSHEIFNELQVLSGQNAMEIPGVREIKDAALYFEARYKIINRFLRKSNASQILEIASGLSPRGLEFTNGGNIKFVEFDLPEIIKQKQIIINELINKKLTISSPNLYFEQGNVFSVEDLNKACSHFDSDKPIAIVTEGLLRYLTFAEKEMVAQNIHSILSRMGGFWLTTDTQYLGNRTESAKSGTESFSKIVGRNISKNYFKDIKEAEDFFSNLGFKIEKNILDEIADELTSPEKLHLTESQIKADLGKRYLFIMKF